MNFINLLTTQTRLEDVIRELTPSQAEYSYDLGVLFMTPQADFKFEELAELLQKSLRIRHLIGCSCAGVIGTSTELENKAATSLMLATLPNVTIEPVALNQTQLEQVETQEDWYSIFDIYPTDKPVFLVFADPFSFDINRFLEGVNKAYPQMPVVGGLASSSMTPGENVVWVDGTFQQVGLAGVVLSGNIQVSTIVSQGCRPIGEVYIVTKAQGNIIYELAGRPFLEVLRAMVDKLPARDRRLVEQALLIGIAMNEYTHQFKRGDFLIRGLLGVDEKLGAAAIGDHIQTGQTVQFHVRDMFTAIEDLKELYSDFKKKLPKSLPKGALVFSCNGRGSNLFETPNHDIKTIQNYVGPLPAAGFFCAGEIGPVGGRNFVHGFTNSTVLFFPREDAGNFPLSGK